MNLWLLEQTGANKDHKQANTTWVPLTRWENLSHVPGGRKIIPLMLKSYRPPSLHQDVCLFFFFIIALRLNVNAFLSFLKS